MSYRAFLWIAAAIAGLALIFVIQYSLVPFLPASLRLLQLPVVLIIAVYLLEAPVGALYAALILGVLLDIGSSHPFGIYTITLLACAIIAYGLLQAVFTNRSLYSFIAITVIVSVAFMLIFAAIGKTTSIFTGNTLFYNWTFYFRAGILTALWHSLIVAFAYYALAAWNRQFLK